MDNEHPTRGEYEILEARVDHLEQINARLLARLDALEARSSGLSPIHSEYNTNGEGKKGRIEKMIVYITFLFRQYNFSPLPTLFQLRALAVLPTLHGSE